MKFSTVLWITLVIVGLFGAFRFSAIFFGLFTVGLFLIFYDRGVAREKPPSTPQPIQSTPLSTTTVASTHTCQNCGMVLEADAAFCPRCGGKVRKE